jgi:hypothetical protein
MSNKFNVGDMVIMTREPTIDDWYGVGEVDIPSVYYEKPHKVTKIGDRDSIELNGSFFVYPSSCFELAHEHAAEQYKKDIQKKLLVGEAIQKFCPGTRFTNAYGSTSTVSDNPQYKYDDGYLYANCVTGRHVRIYDKVTGWSDIICSSHTQAKKGDYIKILHTNGYSGIKGETFYVVNVTDNQNFELAKPGAGDTATIRWACSNPGYYEIRNTVEVVNEYKGREYSDIGMSNYEPTPREFRVGDRVRVIEDDHFFHVGHVAVVQEKNSEGVRLGKTNGESWWIANHKIQHTDDYPRYSVDLPVFNSKSIDLALSELKKDYFKQQIKNQHNGTENTESVKLQRVNLKIREGNPIRRIGLKSSGSKIKLGSNYSYN